ncbi:hypothetical protein NQ314_008712 [Rhamnusium bicolor]|uniref:MYND-type domain-containing protein n=1 Tax=Rhamnusium bicolor TaxID=1586634 RepID=A0AAV8Y614_9CUCU|nr:hypothetical protein NQ314_008712 [Rhamnusium bicolor]
MDYVYKLTKKLPIFHEKSQKMQYKKSDENSLKYRKEGNELFIRKKDNFKALQLYTKSIAYAENNGENLSIAYANRSAEKLLHRQQKAKSLESSQKIYSYHDSIPTIKNKNPLIDAASDSVEIGKNEKWGRYVMATKDIKPGDIICVEKPYAQEVAVTSKYLHCHECLELCYNMIPCENCTEVLYCSENCREQANKTYHKYECILFQLGLREQRLFLRVALNGMSEYKNMKVDLMNDEGGIYRSGRYKEIYELLTHKTDRAPYYVFQDTLEAVVFYHYLKNFTDILKETDIDNKEQVLKELLLHHTLSMHCNATCIEKPKQIDFGQTDVSFNTTSKVQRQYELQIHYHFTCECEACVKDWPTGEYLRAGKHIPKSFMEKMLKLYKQEIIDKSTVDKLLNDAFDIASSMKGLPIPSRNYNYINGIICDLFIFQGNRLLDF